jgi:hypothetical protein
MAAAASSVVTWKVSFTVVPEPSIRLRIFNVLVAVVFIASILMAGPGGIVVRRDDGPGRADQGEGRRDGGDE